MKEKEEKYEEDNHLFKIIIQIDHNLPIERPDLHKRYPFVNMKIGDSFFVPCDDNTHSYRVAQCKIISCSKWYKKAHNRNFKVITRKVENGIRCWRIK